MFGEIITGLVTALVIILMSLDTKSNCSYSHIGKCKNHLPNPCGHGIGCYYNQCRGVN